MRVVGAPFRPQMFGTLMLSAGVLMNVCRILGLATLCAVVAFATPVSAQIDRSDLKGNVTDESGARVPNAKVTVLFPQTGFTRTVVTSASGDYVFAGLPLGLCNIFVTQAALRKRGRVECCWRSGRPEDRTSKWVLKASH